MAVAEPIAYYFDRGMCVRADVSLGLGEGALTEEGRKFDAKVAQACIYDQGGIGTETTCEVRSENPVRTWPRQSVLLSWLSNLEGRLPGVEILLQSMLAHPDFA